jgi:hypothetical protein
MWNARGAQFRDVWVVIVGPEDRPDARGDHGKIADIPRRRDI